MNGDSSFSQSMKLNCYHVLFILEHAKEALELSKMQETTHQIENQKQLKVIYLHVWLKFDMQLSVFF